MQNIFKLKAGSIDALPSLVGSGTTSIVPALCFMKTVPIPKTRRYFISPGGFVVKIENGREVRLPVYYKGSKRPFVKIDGNERELIYLMLQCFNIEFSPKDRLKYSVTDDGCILLSGIKIIPFESKYEKGELKQNDRLILDFGCDIKCYSANNRGCGVITPFQILICLRNSDFKCTYCRCGLEMRNWHLDHYIPVSKGGLNDFKNIVPSCSTCNMMKSDLMPSDFIKICKKIYLENKLGIIQMDDINKFIGPYL